MLPRAVTRPSLLVPCLLALACGGSVPGSPDGTVEAVGVALAKNDVTVAWQALPERYQKDVHTLVHAFAGKMDAQVYDKTFVVVRKLADVLDEKGKYILDNEMLAALGADRAELEKNWRSVVGMVETLADSDIARLDDLVDLDVGDFLASTGRRLMVQAASVAASQPEMREEWARQVASLAKMKVEVIDQADGQATVRVQRPGEEDQPEVTLKLTQVDGRWVPADLARDWDAEVARMKQEIEALDVSGDKAQALAVLGAVEGALDGLLAATSKEQFEQALQQGMPMVMGALMGGMLDDGGGEDPFEYEIR